MTNTAHPVLCGGTFLTLILQSRKPTATRRRRVQGETDNFREPDVLFELIKLVQPDYIKPAGDTFNTYTTNYKKCAEYTPDDLKFQNETVKSAFMERLASDYTTELKKATIFANQFIDIGSTAQNDILLVKRLIELIRDERSIPDATCFVISRDGTSIMKGELAELNEIYLPAFLLDVWRYIVSNQIDNSIGVTTIAAWFPEGPSRYKGISGSTIVQSIKVGCDVTVVSKQDTNDTANEEPVKLPVEKFMMPDVYTYLGNVENKYKTVKILLDTDNHFSFYDIYVCNKIRYRVLNNKEDRNQQSDSILEEATIEKISQLTQFAIICGTGGLGKSMMMRHLLLDAIANYDDRKLFPAFIPLKDYDGIVTSLFDYAFSKIYVFDRNLKPEHFEQMLLNGSCIILFDGLDEIGANYSQKFERELEAFTDKYSKNMFILSSRPFQSFVSFERFSLLHLLPFTKRQAMQLINKLEFRPDEPEIKKKFLAELEKTLFQKHRSFSENPLLLTIMLLTFEQFAEIPSKMHVFYREAFEVLARRHDASKGAYKRPLRTGLSIDAFEDYFSELCFRSYNDEKFELLSEEFTRYFNELNARKMANDNKSTARDFLDDLCSNLCLMYFEGGRYLFTHRSFQEYFCALFLSKQKDKFIAKLGDFFEKHYRRMFGDRTFSMLYDMIPEKVEEYIFLPFLSMLFDKYEKADGYWTFLEDMYPQISYSDEDSYSFMYSRLFETRSFIFSAALITCGYSDNGDSLADLPYFEEFEIERMPRFRQEAVLNSVGDVIDFESVEDEEGWYLCSFDVAKVRQQPEKYGELLNVLNNDEFILKKQFLAAQQFLKDLVEKQKTESNNLLDFL